MESSRAVWIAVVLVLLVAGVLCFAVRRFLGGRHRAPEPLWSVVLARASVFLVAASGAVSTVVVLAAGFASRPSPNTVLADGPQAPIPDATAPIPLPLPVPPVEAPSPPAARPVAFRSPVVPDEPVFGGRPVAGVPVAGGADVPAVGDPGVPALAMIPGPRGSSSRSVAVPAPRSSDDGSSWAGSRDTRADDETRAGSCHEETSHDRAPGTWSSPGDDGAWAGHRDGSSRHRAAGRHSSSTADGDGYAGHRDGSSRNRVAGTHSSVDRAGGHRAPDGGDGRRVTGKRPGRHLAPDAGAGRHRPPLDQGARHGRSEARTESTADRSGAPRQESGRHGGADRAPSSGVSAGE